MPVPGSDGRRHLSYALRFLNLGAYPVRITAAAIDPIRGEASEPLANRVRNASGADVTGQLRPYPVQGDVPRDVEHGGRRGRG